jgi:hypothetical protein
VRHEFGMRRLEVPNDVVGKCIGVGIQCLADERNVASLC